MDIMEAIRQSTLVDRPRLESIATQLDRTKGLDGDVAEVGVYRGGSALWILNNTAKHTWLFDTFQGLPQPTKEDNYHKLGDFNDTSMDQVNRLLQSFEKSNYTLLSGIFPRETGLFITNKKFSLVHLDVDLYSSVKNCLYFFWPRMVSGGVIILDDYNEPDCLGAKQAADEFAAEHGRLIQPTTQSQALLEVP